MSERNFSSDSLINTASDSGATEALVNRSAREDWTAATTNHADVPGQLYGKRDNFEITDSGSSALRHEESSAVRHEDPKPVYTVGTRGSDQVIAIDKDFADRVALSIESLLAVPVTFWLAEGGEFMNNYNRILAPTVERRMRDLNWDWHQIIGKPIPRDRRDIGHDPWF